MEKGLVTYNICQPVYVFLHIVRNAGGKIQQERYLCAILKF